MRRGWAFEVDMDRDGRRLMGREYGVWGGLVGVRTGGKKGEVERRPKGHFGVFQLLRSVYNDLFRSKAGER